MNPAQLCVKATRLTRTKVESIVASVAVPELNKRIPYPFTLSLYFEDKWALLDVQLSSGVMKVSFPQGRLLARGISTCSG